LTAETYWTTHIHWIERIACDHLTVFHKNNIIRWAAFWNEKFNNIIVDIHLEDNCMDTIDCAINNYSPPTAANATPLQQYPSAPFND
jgi:hypothetical protein